MQGGWGARPTWIQGRADQSWGALPPAGETAPGPFQAWARTFAGRVPDGLGSRVYQDVAAALRRAADALETRARDAERQEQQAAGHYDKGLLALAPTLLDAIMAQDGVDLATAAASLEAQYRHRFPADTLAFHWQVARDRARKAEKHQRGRLVTQLAAQGLTNAEIARHPQLLALNGGKPLHPASVSRILQRGLKQRVARAFPVKRRPPPATPGMEFPKPVRRLFLSAAPAPTPPPHTPAAAPARAPAPPAGRGLSSSLPAMPAIAAE